jgi:AbrB family looped-hinge helix DNA binding protein
MEIVTVSPKFQIVIPRSIRQSFGIKSGQKLHFIEYNGTNSPDSRDGARGGAGLHEGH